MTFVHLHVHSEYSLLDGFSNIEKLVKRASELEMPALALTDHGTMFGVVDFYNAAHNAGIKPIIGVEAYLAAHGMRSRDAQLDKKSTHLLLLAENDIGYRNLLQLCSIAQLEGFYHHPRIDHELLAKYAEGLICTTGCMTAEIPRLILQGELEKAWNKLDWYFEVFGPDRFFLELQSHDIPEITTLNRTLVEMGRRYNGRFIATNDVHYINPSDARLQDILLAIQTGSVLSDPTRMRMTDDSYYLRTPAEMISLFSELPEAIQNTLLIAERCNINLVSDHYHLPDYTVPPGYTPETYLRELCEEGLKNRYQQRAEEPAVRQRLDYELGIIHQMGFDTYFLIVWDLCKHARKENIWYNTRGSAAGSIVAYTLEITRVDPLAYGLFFERFLNPGRITMPDIDLDFRDDLRDQMLAYTAQKYGSDKVAQIITFGTLGAKAAIRDVGRVMDIPLSEVDRAAKLIPSFSGKTLTIAETLEQVPEFRKLYETEAYYHNLIDTAKEMEGVVRSAGTHAAGVIITDKPIVEYAPLHRPTSGTVESSSIKTVTQFEMSGVENLKLLKIDLLGLATLTIMARACALILKRHGVELNLDNIPTDDPATYDLLGRGETNGVFQVEGEGMRRYVMQMKPQVLEHMIAMVALYRPGPMEHIPRYIRCMHGEERIQYKHPSLEPILKETYGNPVYQEQLMFAAISLAGYSAPEADDLRKTISKKQQDKLLEHRQKFIQGSVKSGIPVETAGLIFKDWEDFARYGFNKAHAAEYGILAVKTAYLKAHYPVEYMTAVLSVNLNDTSKVALYVADCRRMGISVQPPDINISDWDFTIEDRPDGKATIRFGMGAVKNVGHNPIDVILKARSEGIFKDINDFAHRVDLRQVSKRALECLVKVGALDCFGPRMALLQALDLVISVSTAHFRARDIGQMSFFGAHTGVADTITLPNPATSISRKEHLNWERELIGLYVSDHPLGPVLDTLTRVVSHYSGQLAEVSSGERVQVAGIINKIRPHQTKAGKPMGFISLEDLQGSLELVLFPRPWEQYSNLIETGKIVLVEGRVDAASGDPKILVDSISTNFKLVTPVGTPSVPELTKPSESRYPWEGVETSLYLDGYPPSDNAFKSKDELEILLPNIINDLGEPTTNIEPHFEAMPGEVSLASETQTVSSPANFSKDIPLEELTVPLYNQDGLHGIDQGDGELTQHGEAGDTSPDLDIPPPLEDFPEDWQVADAVMAAITRDGIAPTFNNHTNQPEPIPVSASNLEQERRLNLPGDQTTTPQISIHPNTPALVRTSAPDLPPSYIVQPQSIPESKPARMITIILRSTGDKVRDNIRIRQIYGTLITYPGNDSFAFQVYERNRGYLIEFPNFTTGICPELLSRLKVFVSPENLHIQPITIQ